MAKVLTRCHPLFQQACEIADTFLTREFEDVIEDPYEEGKTYTFEEYIEAELRKAFDAGQRAALERSGIQPALEMEEK